MSGHVAPYRWADAWAGRVAEPEVAAMERHAEGCRRCARARDRITRVSSSTFPAIRTLSPPELPWDAVRAKVHWTVSSETQARRRLAGGSRARTVALWGLAAAGSVAVALATARTARFHEAAPAAALAAAPAATTAAPEPSARPITGVVSRLAGDVMIDGLRPGDAFGRAIGAGTLLATGNGRIDVQFGDASAFSLGPRSSLELRRFDARAVELVVEGTVDVVVAPRAPGQRFLVLAGDRTVEVRGTQFRVTHDKAGTAVACRHGLVAVSTGTAAAPGAPVVEVGAAQHVELPAGKSLAGARVLALSAPELAELVQATPAMLPLWSDAKAIAHSSATLDIAASTRRAVRVDGIELGAAPLRVRVLPGRHLVEAADAAGRFRHVSWVEAHAGKTAHVALAAEAAPSIDASHRQRELHAGLARIRPELSRCTRAIAKAGLTGTYVTLEISVDAQGAVPYLNIVDTDLGSTTAACVHDALAQIRFDAGPAASWREKLDL